MVEYNCCFSRVNWDSACDILCSIDSIFVFNRSISVDWSCIACSFTFTKSRNEEHKSVSSCNLCRSWSTLLLYTCSSSTWEWLIVSILDLCFSPISDNEFLWHSITVSNSSDSLLISSWLVLNNCVILLTFSRRSSSIWFDTDNLSRNDSSSDSSFFTAFTDSLNSNRNFWIQSLRDSLSLSKIFRAVSTASIVIVPSDSSWTKTCFRDATSFVSRLISCSFDTMEKAMDSNSLSFSVTTLTWSEFIVSSLILVAETRFCRSQMSLINCLLVTSWDCESRRDLASTSCNLVDSFSTVEVSSLLRDTSSSCCKTFFSIWLLYCVPACCNPEVRSSIVASSSLSSDSKDNFSCSLSMSDSFKTAISFFNSDTLTWWDCKFATVVSSWMIFDSDSTIVSSRSIILSALNFNSTTNASLSDFNSSFEASTRASSTFNDRFSSFWWERDSLVIVKRRRRFDSNASADASFSSVSISESSISLTSRFTWVSCIRCRVALISTCNCNLNDSSCISMTFLLRVAVIDSFSTCNSESSVFNDRIWSTCVITVCSLSLNTILRLLICSSSRSTSDLPWLRRCFADSNFDLRSVVRAVLSRASLRDISSCSWIWPTVLSWISSWLESSRTLSLNARISDSLNDMSTANESLSRPRSASPVVNKSIVSFCLELTSFSFVNNFSRSFACFFKQAQSRPRIWMVALASARDVVATSNFDSRSVTNVFCSMTSSWDLESLFIRSWEDKSCSFSAFFIWSMKSRSLSCKDLISELRRHTIDSFSFACTWHSSFASTAAPSAFITNSWRSLTSFSRRSHSEWRWSSSRSPSSRRSSAASNLYLRSMYNSLCRWLALEDSTSVSDRWHTSAKSVAFWRIISSLDAWSSFTSSFSAVVSDWRLSNCNVIESRSSFDSCLKQVNSFSFEDTSKVNAFTVLSAEASFDSRNDMVDDNDSISVLRTIPSETSTSSLSSLSIHASRSLA